MIALAAAADGARLVAECFGDTVGWLPWQRPGFELGLALRSLCADRPQLRGVVMGGHGLIAWGDDGDACEANSIALIERADRFVADRGRAAPLGAIVPARRPLPEARRRAEACRLAPIVRGLVSTDERVVGHFSDRAGRARLPRARGGAAARARSGRRAPITSCAPRSVPCCSTPARRALRRAVERLRARHAEYRSAYEAYYTAYATPDSPAMRGADPRIVLLPGIGMWSFGADPHTAQVAGEFFVNAINVMRGAEAVSSYTPIPDDEKFRVEYWELEERKLRCGRARAR